MMRWVPLGLFILFATGLFIGLFREDRDILRSTLIEKQAREFSLPLYEESRTTLTLAEVGKMAEAGAFEASDLLTAADLKGDGPAILNFWASWCGPCIVEHPELVKLSKIDDVRLFGINQRDKPKDTKRFLERYGNPFDAIGMDTKGRASVEYGVTALPETFVLRGDGTIIYKHVGPINPGDMEEKILPAIEAARQN